MNIFKWFNDLINKPEPAGSYGEPPIEDVLIIAETPITETPPYDWAKRKIEVRKQILKSIDIKSQIQSYKDWTYKLETTPDYIKIIDSNGLIHVFDYSFVGLLDYKEGNLPSIENNGKSYYYTETHHYPAEWAVFRTERPFRIDQFPELIHGNPDILIYADKEYHLPIGSAKEIYDVIKMKI